MYDILVISSRFIFIVLVILIFIFAILCFKKAKATANKKRYISIGLVLFLLFGVFFRYGFFGSENKNTNIEVESLPMLLSNVAELFGNEGYSGNFETSDFAGSILYVYNENVDECKEEVDSITKATGKIVESGNIDGVFYRIRAVTCSHRELYVLGIPSGGIGSIIVWDDNHILELGYTYSSKNTDFLFPMTSPETFYCQKIDLTEAIEAIEQAKDTTILSDKIISERFFN